MADAFPGDSFWNRYARWVYRRQLPIDALFWLAFSAFLVLLTVLALIAVLLAEFA